MYLKSFKPSIHCYRDWSNLIQSMHQWYFISWGYTHISLICCTNCLWIKATTLVLLVHTRWIWSHYKLLACFSCVWVALLRIVTTSIFDVLKSWSHITPIATIVAILDYITSYKIGRSYCSGNNGMVIHCVVFLYKNLIPVIHKQSMHKG